MKLLLPSSRCTPPMEGRKAPQQPLRPSIVPQPIQTGPSQGMISQQRYPNRPQRYYYYCGSPDHYANVCPFERQGQGALLILSCQNCQEYGHMAPHCPKPQQKWIV